MRAITEAPLLDVRPAAAFEERHVPGSAGIPLEELTARPHELPPQGGAIAVFDWDWDRARQAVIHLRQAGFTADAVKIEGAALTEKGPATGRLWRPSPFLDEVLGVTGAAVPQDPRRALDLGCGAGREAVVMAQAGYAVTAIDILPDALARAQDLAGRWGVRLDCVRQDLRRKPVLPADCFHLTVMFRFFEPGLIPAVRAAVAPGGHVACEVFHAGEQRAGRRAPRQAVEDGVLRSAFDGFEILAARDGVERDGRLFAQLLARRPA